MITTLMCFKEQRMKDFSMNFAASMLICIVSLAFTEIVVKVKCLSDGTQARKLWCDICLMTPSFTLPLCMQSKHGVLQVLYG